MKILCVLVCLLLTQLSAFAEDGELFVSSKGSANISVTIVHRIVVKENSRSRKLEIQKETNVQVKKVEKQDANGNRVIIFTPAI